MAEFVQQSIEEMLPELQQMERVGLFTKEETRQILRRRKGYEYKLRRRTKCKEDFLQYIQYEINALGLVKMRREKIGYSFKKLEIDIAIVQRIHQLFRLATTRFKDDIKLWLSHIEFAKERREKATVSRLFTNMLQIHNKKPDLWLLAAKWEFEENVNSENARSLLQRGLRFNSDSRKLWLEYYRMELLFAEKMRKRREVLGGPLPEDETEVSDAVLQGAVARVVYQQALEAIPGKGEWCISRH
ncbi:U3 small nucleolar RNA-associated protein 6 homolog [Liolophura sinensis]|uniref:U3 small nucleolar RNA-associated protein 6 homolog n=1 Tax=Liolophura sinensis TaxID=3198878 RepID=UPI003159353C